MAKLVNANGNGGSMVAEELRRTGVEMDEATERLAKVEEDLHALEGHVLTECGVIDALERLDPVWDALFPAEQARIVGLLVERVDITSEGLKLRLRAEGLRSLVAEVSAGGVVEKEAAR